MKIKVLKVFKLVITLSTVILILLVIFARNEHKSSARIKLKNDEKLNEIHDFSLGENEVILEENIAVEAENDGIMYFHLLFEKVDADTFFYLKESSIYILKDVNELETAELTSVKKVDDLLLYEIISENNVFRFKYILGSNHLFYEKYGKEESQ